MIKLGLLPQIKTVAEEPRGIVLVAGGHPMVSSWKGRNEQAGGLSNVQYFELSFLVLATCFS